HNRQVSRRIRLLVSSVDGTLLAPDGTLTEQSRAAVRRLADADIAFTVVTGHPPQRLRPLIDALDLTTPLAALGGGLIVGSDLDVIVEHRMDRRGVETAIATLSAGGFDIWVYTADQWLVRTHGPHVDRETAIVGAEPTVVETFDGVLPRAVKIVGVS